MMFARHNDLAFIIGLAHVLGAGYGPKLRQSSIELRRETTLAPVSHDKARKS